MLIWENPHSCSNIWATVFVSVCFLCMEVSPLIILLTNLYSFLGTLSQRDLWNIIIPNKVCQACMCFDQIYVSCFETAHLFDYLLVSLSPPLTYHSYKFLGQKYLSFWHYIASTPGLWWAHTRLKNLFNAQTVKWVDGWMNGWIE